MKKSITTLASLLLVMLFTAFAASAQNPVAWNASVKMTSANEGEIVLTGKIDKGWHVYGFTQSEDGPIATTVKMGVSKGAKFTDLLRYSPKLTTVVDDVFGVEVTYWENAVTLTRKFKIDSGVAAATAKVTVEYMACNDSSCMPPKTETFTLKLK